MKCLTKHRAGQSVAHRAVELLMNLRVLIFAFLLTGLHAAEVVDDELGRLQHAMKSADNQLELNEASAELADYWDRVLAKEETRISASCDAERATLFRNAQRLWREFRLAETKLQEDEYRGGSIQPLIRNSTFASLTEQRVKTLRAMSKPE